MNKICFVLMPFNDYMQEVYDYAIKPAAISSGFDCNRADDPLKPRNIVKHIIKSIFNADLIIADITGTNPNVLYELGIAHSIGNNVVLIAEEQKEKLPFDLSSYRVIFYKKNINGVENELKSKLEIVMKELDEWKDASSNPVQDFRPYEYAIPLSKQAILESEINRLAAKVAFLEAEIQRKNLIKYSILVSEIEFRHLHKLFDDGDFNYVKRSVFLIELLHLQHIGLIKTKQGVKLENIPDRGNLKDYIELTSDAVDYLKVRLLEYGA